jgi:hypothetical protein
MRKKAITAIVISVFAVSLWAVPTASAWLGAVAVLNPPKPPSPDSYCLHCGGPLKRGLTD